MTRLVRVRAICDGCSAAAATRFCVSLRSVLCETCKCIRSRSRHRHVTLVTAFTALAFCEYCDIAPATIYCETEGATLCDKCNETVHKTGPFSHCRSPIQNTLRTRAVEFRPRSRSRACKRLARSSGNQPANAQQVTANVSCLDPKEKRITAQRSYARSSRPSKSLSVSKQSQQRQQPSRNAQITHSAPVAQPPAPKQPTPKSSALASHNHGGVTPSNPPPPLVATSTASTEQPQPLSFSQLPDDPPRNDLFHTDDYTPLLDSQPTHSNVNISIDTLTFSSPLPTEIAEAAKSLCEPLLVTEEPNIQPMETDPLAEPETCTLDLSNVLSSASLDLSTDDLQHINLKPPPPSPYLLSTSVPTSNAVQFEARHSHSPPQSTITAAAAAAATAAAEKYLLNNAQHLTAFQAKISTSLVANSRVLDPGGVAAAASAAAAVEMSSLSSQARNSKAQESGRLPRHVSEPVLPLRAAAQQHVYDEAMRRLDIDLFRNRLKEEAHVMNGKQQFSSADGPSHVLAPVHEYSNSELGRRLAVDDAEKQREELAPFGSLRQSQFDQTPSSSLAFESGMDFTAPHGSDDG